MSDKLPYLSIIIPVYNRASLVVETLCSISAQTHLDYECIIIDDHSTDGTWDILIDYCTNNSKFSCHLKPPELPRGPSASRNYGLTISQGEYVHFFDSDDLLEPHFYHLCLEKLIRENLDALAVRINWFSESDPIGVLSGAFTHDDFIQKAITRQHDIWTQNVVWRHALLKSCPGFREDISMGEDILFAVGALKNSQSFSYDNSLNVKVRRHQQSLTSTDNPIRNLERQKGVFDTYLGIYLALKGSNYENNESKEYCMTKLYQSLSQVLPKEPLTKSSLHNLSILIITLFKEHKFQLLFRTIFFIPIKFFFMRYTRPNT